MSNKNITCTRDYLLNIPQMLSGGMSENWLLKELGDVHWSMIADALDSKSDEIIDSNGERLYASFVRLQWSLNSRCLYDFNENEKVQLKGDLALYGNKMFFSEDVLLGDNKEIKANLMSVFSSRKSGNNQQLLKGKPLNVKNIKTIVHQDLPDFASAFFNLKGTLFSKVNNNDNKKQFETVGHCFDLEEKCGFTKPYDIDPYDDINGVGLLYFASYPKISDKCERYYFQENYERIDKEDFNWAEIAYSLARDIHYYGNANVNDELLYVLENYFIEESNTIKLVSSLYRKKDNKLIAKIFTVKRIVFPIVKKELYIEKRKNKDISITIDDSTMEIDNVTIDKKTLDSLLIAFFSKMFSNQVFTTKSDLRSLGIESIVFLELTEFLNVNHNLSVNPSDFYGLYTIDQISNKFVKGVNILDSQSAILNDDEFKKNQSEEDIAIIGVAFKLPGGIETKEAFWNILKEGKNVIQELPFNRWKWSEDIDVNSEHKGINFGGFMEDVTLFDADFFNISPLEAETMDPQQRKLLEICWHCLEDAGITNDQLRGSNTGVFVGASGSDYSKYFDNENSVAHAGVGISTSVLANRISHFYDLKGPSIQIDTACSSSLVALHQAVSSIKNNECEQAIVSGVNIMLHPFNSQVYYKAGMLNKEGLCRTFDKDAAGYVRGEGIISLFIKPLSKALQDQDIPYAVIKGSAINHGGYAGGITVPNPNQQSALIEKALANAKIKAKDVTFVETHGTGTKLGDPIEINALNKVFKSTNSLHSCLIGSVKTNIGHLEAAAGLAGLVKVLLSFEKESIPPIANFKELNPHINLSNSPLIINQEIRKWEVPNDGKRIAGISSFGSGGTNAHVILEQIPSIIQSEISSSDNYLICVSGNTNKALNSNIDKLLEWLNNYETVDLLSISHNLLVRRTHFPHRAAFIVSNVDELKKLLVKKTSTSESGNEYYSTDYNQTNSQPLFIEWFENYLNGINKYSDLEKNQLGGLAELYVRGSSINWKKMFKNLTPKRESLPFYEFEKNFFWITSNNNQTKGEKNRNTFIHDNYSRYNLQAFVSNFSGEEFFFKEHKIEEKSILPGVAYLEMIRYCIDQSFPEKTKSIRINELIWKNPITNNELYEIYTEIKVEEEDKVVCNIINKLNNQEYCSAEISFSQKAKKDKRDIEVLQSQYGEDVSPDMIYGRMNQMGYHYGNSFRTIKKLSLRENEAIGILKSSKSGQTKSEELDIQILDGALQIAMYAFFISKENSKTVYPFYIESFRINESLLDSEEDLYVYTYKQDDKIQIEIINQQGDICYEFHNMIFKSQEHTSSKEVKLYAPGKRVLLELNTKETIKSRVLIGYGEHEFLKELNSLVINDEIETSIFTLKPETDIKNVYKVVKSLVALLREIIRSKSEKTIFFLYKNEIGINYSNVFSGVFSCLCQEYENISFQIVAIENCRETYSEIIENLTKSFHRSNKKIVLDNGKMYGFKWKEITNQLLMPWKDRGVYLITGGAGKIGKHFGEIIASKVISPTIIFIGRSRYDEIKEEQIKGLIELGAQAEYKSLDIGDAKQLLETKNYILSKFGQINGIIHAAGVNQDELFYNIKEESIERVLHPKVAGTINLDTVFKEEKIDFMMLFSSIISVIGNTGQTSYAAANGFIDDFAIYRNQLVEKKQRFGKTVAINWPYWIDGGMKMPLEIQNEIQNRYGLIPLKTDKATGIIDEVLSGNESQVMVAVGNHDKFLAIINGAEKKVSIQPKEGIEAINVSAIIKKVIGKVIKKESEELNELTPFDQMGIDSIIQMNILKELSKTFGELSKTLLFEYVNIKELSEYMMNSNKPINLETLKKEPIIKGEALSSFKYPTGKVAAFKVKQEPFYSKIEPEDIAIIGFSGRFPKSDSVAVFWDNLQKGRDCISLMSDFREVPKNKQYYGGFIDDIDKFDASLFRIENKDVVQLTPEERLFLEIAWETLQDAGYNEERLKDIQDKTNQGIGVFVGSMYDQYGSHSQSETGRLATNWSNWQIANRTSHFFNFIGPSLLINTACSSAFSAIHTACESILTGNSSMALVGAVNLTLDHTKFSALENASYLEKGTKSKSFGEGTGYLPGEGVGAILLKPLSKAIEDHDRIDGIIKSTTINHSGGRLKYTTPDPSLQAKLIEKSLQKAQVKKSDIGYIECAANGSELGDPIEIAALKSVFNKEQSISKIVLGAVKANIGHLEAVSGISQIIKVLLQFRHNTLVPSINSNPLNKAISLKETPFKIQNHTEVWPDSLSKMSMINSFGAGGSYANIILDRAETNSSHGNQNINLNYFIFSAHSKNSLQNYLKKIKTYLLNEDIDLPSLSATLIKISRDLSFKVGIQAESKSILIKKITWFLENFSDSNQEEIYYSKSMKIKENNYQDSLLVRWIKDGVVSEELKKAAVLIPPISLPTYAFEHEDSYPIQVKDKKGQKEQKDDWDNIYQTILSSELKEEEFKLLLNH